MRFSAIDNAIEAQRVGSKPTVVAVVPAAHLAYVAARAVAHQTISAGELTSTAARQLGQACRLIVVKEP